MGLKSVATNNNGAFDCKFIWFIYTEQILFLVYLPKYFHYDDILFIECVHLVAMRSMWRSEGNSRESILLALAVAIFAS